VWHSEPGDSKPRPYISREYWQSAKPFHTFKELYMIVTLVVCVGVADVRREPDPTSELVTQALMNVPAVTGEFSGDWTHATLADYEGWIRTNELDDPIAKSYYQLEEHCCTPIQLVAIVTATHTSLYVSAQGNDTQGKVYLSTVLPLLDISQKERVKVAGPGESEAWIDRNAIDVRQPVEIYPRASTAVITGYARAFLGVPYLWGGTSWEGLDCSGFVQLCYRMGGYILPRDADQQHDCLAHDATRQEMREGDLIFFGRKNITHVGMALNNSEFIHSEGQDYNCVTINSFNRADEHYSPKLDEIVWGLKRVVE
jgi:cell wall-associated NlpC family hydrolase